MEKKIRKRILAMGGMLLFSTAVLGQQKFNHAEYLNPKTEDQKRDQFVKGSISFDKDKRTIEFIGDKGDLVISIPADRINSLLYETKLPLLPVHPRFKKDFLTIQYTDTDGTGKSAVIHMDERNARRIVACAQAQSGKKADRNDHRQQESSSPEPGCFAGKK
jgi:hypothetical protein